MSFWSQSDFKEPLRANKWYIEFTGILKGARIALKECKKPSYKVSETKHRCFNHVVNLPGTVTWDPVTVKFTSTRGFSPGDDASNLIHSVLKQGGYKIPTSFLETAVSKTLMHNALETGLLNIIQIDADGNPVEVWSLYNAYISVVNYGSLSYENEGLVDIDCTITYDWAELNEDSRAKRLGIIPGAITQDDLPEEEITTEPEDTLPLPETDTPPPAEDGADAADADAAAEGTEDSKGPPPEATSDDAEAAAEGTADSKEPPPEANSDDADAAAEGNLSPSEKAERDAQLAQNLEDKAEKAQELSQKYRENPTEANRLAALSAREEAATAANQYRNATDSDGQPIVASTDLRKEDIFREDVPIPEEKQQPAQTSDTNTTDAQAAAEGDKLVTVNYNGVDVKIKASEADADLDTSTAAAKKAYQNKTQQANENAPPPEGDKPAPASSSAPAPEPEPAPAPASSSAPAPESEPVSEPAPASTPARSKMDEEMGDMNAGIAAGEGNKTVTLTVKGNPPAQKDNEPPVQEKSSSAGEPTQQEKDDAIRQAKEAVAASRQITKDQEDSARAQRAADDEDEPPVQEKSQPAPKKSTGTSSEQRYNFGVSAEEAAKGEQLLADVKGDNKRSSQQAPQTSASEPAPAASAPAPERQPAPAASESTSASQPAPKKSTGTSSEQGYNFGVSAEDAAKGEKLLTDVQGNNNRSSQQTSAPSTSQTTNSTSGYKPGITGTVTTDTKIVSKREAERDYQKTKKDPFGSLDEGLAEKNKK